MERAWMQVGRVIVVVLMVAASLGSALIPASAQDTGVDGDVYTNGAYGFTIEFDDEIWEATLIEQTIGEGVAFEPIDPPSGALYAQFRVEYDDVTNPVECLDTMVRDYRSVGAWETFEEDPDIEAPESAPDVENVTISAEDDGEPQALYMECRAVTGGTLNAVFGGDAETYEEWIPAFEDLLAGVTVDEVEDDADDDADGPALDGNVYANPDAGWSIEFDDEIWAPLVLDSNMRRGIAFNIIELDEDTIFNSVQLIVGDESPTDVKECLDVAELEVAIDASFEEVEPTDDLDAPETADDAEGRIYAATLGNGTDVVIYLECRAVDGGTLLINFQVDAEVYEDVLPLWEDLLAGISTDDANDDSDRDEDADTGDDEDADPDDEERDAEQDDEDTDNDRDADSDDTSTGEAETGLDGNVFTDAEVGFTVEFDDTWEAELIEGDFQPVLYLVIADEPAYATASIDGSFGYGEMTPADCVEAYVDSLPDAGPYDDVEEADDLDLPESEAEGDAAATVYRYTYTFQDGEVAELVGYMECRRTGDDSMVRIFVQIDEESYEEQAEVLEDLLAGITVTGSPDADSDNESTDEDDAEDENENENENENEEAA